MQNNPRSRQGEDFLRLQDLLSLCLAGWRWFVLSFIVIMGVAIIYLLTTPPVYTRSANILIKEDSKGNSMSGELNSFSDLGLFQSNTNVNNELISLQSPAIMLEVVKRLHLDVGYLTDGRFHKRTLYGQEVPFNVSFHDLADIESGTLTLSILEDGRLRLSDFTRNNEKVEPRQDCTGHPGDTLHTPLGRVTVSSIPYYKGGETPVFYISRSSLSSAVSQCTANLSVSLNDEKSSVITLSYKDVSTLRAEEILNTLIAVYNENWVRDKNQIAISTSRFINERLNVIEQELGHVDNDISSYKSEHLLPDVQAASSMYMTQANEAGNRMFEVDNQLYMAHYIRNYLTNAANKNLLLPANSGIDNTTIEHQISEYNDKQLQRNSLIANSSEQNPLVIDLDHALASMRRAIVSSIDNQVVTLNTRLRNLRQSERQTTARIAANPTQAKYLLSVERQQKVKEALYLFLLQKREENELSQAFTAYNTRVITPPMGSMVPTAPVRRNILLVAFALSLLIPTVVIFIRENTNTTVRSRKDLENMTLPFIGEIPFYYPKKKQFCFFERRKKEGPREILVKEKNRNVINESFRVVRTNLEFMNGRDNRIKVIMLSSANIGSGKTFIALNLAATFAIKGKKVLIIDLDLRKASLSEYVGSPKKGISDYLNGQIDDYREIIVPDKQSQNLHIIPVGTLPPNPSEILADERLSQLIDHYLRSAYDYIFLDCPPAEIVADASIINKLADQTLFIIRAGLLDRGMLPQIEKLNAENKYKNMSLILNGTDSTGRYGYHKYGYGYGYEYGYGKDTED